MSPDEFVRKHMNGGHLYHFTDTRNLPSIRKRGLLSRRELNALGVSDVVTGGNDWSISQDDRFGLDAFVHLCFFDSHPMEYLAAKEKRIIQSKFLRVDPAVICGSGVKLSLGVSNKNDVQVLEPAEAFTGMDTEVIFSRTNWKDPAIKERLKVAKKYEVLVPTSVALASIRGL